TTQRVWFGTQKEARLGVAEDAALTIPKGQIKNLKASFTLLQPQLSAPLAKNQVVGTIDFQLDGKSIGQRPLVALDDIPQSGFFSRLWDNVMMKVQQWFGSWFG
ncbi:serine-type D-Ala-D-Ala carboxypeptidase, partial [Escherichia coli]